MELCPLCGAEAEAVLLSEVSVTARVIYPSQAGALVKNAREFVVGEHALLHHCCLSPQANTDTRWWNPDKSWWACHDPDRPIDDFANFDLNCSACATRWATENSN